MALLDRNDDRIEFPLSDYGVPVIGFYATVCCYLRRPGNRERIRSQLPRRLRVPPVAECTSLDEDRVSK